MPAIFTLSIFLVCFATTLAQTTTSLRVQVTDQSGAIIVGATVTIQCDRALQKVGEGLFAPNAHSVAADTPTHRVFFPLQNVGGKPVLRIALPSDKQL
jgi:hypothetical protein